MKLALLPVIGIIFLSVDLFAIPDVPRAVFWGRQAGIVLDILDAKTVTSLKETRSGDYRMIKTAGPIQCDMTTKEKDKNAKSKDATSPNNPHCTISDPGLEAQLTPFSFPSSKVSVAQFEFSGEAARILFFAMPKDSITSETKTTSEFHGNVVKKITLDEENPGYLYCVEGGGPVYLPRGLPVCSLAIARNREG